LGGVLTETINWRWIFCVGSVIVLADDPAVDVLAARCVASPRSR
jgi:hypothetical protein